MNGLFSVCHQPMFDNIFYVTCSRVIALKLAHFNFIPLKKQLDVSTLLVLAYKGKISYYVYGLCPTFDLLVQFPFTFFC
jgi:hypothetical protein